MLKPYTILLQGQINEESFNLWIKNHADSNVVVSVWDDEDLSNYEIPKKWKIVKNPYPFLRFAPKANLDYQIITTLSGLNNIKSKWVIKMRCDEYWSNLDKVFDKMLKNPDKIISGSMFFRKWGLYRFHIGDKIMGGSVDNLILMFESTLHNLEIKFWNTDIPESQLGIGYIMGKEKDINIRELKKTLTTPLKKSNPIKKNISELTSTIYKALEITNQKAFGILTKEFNYSSKNLNLDDIKTEFDYIASVLSNVSNTIANYEFKPLDEKILIKKWFDIIDVNELKPYVATQNFGGIKKRVWYRDDFDNEENDCLTKIN